MDDEFAARGFENVGAWIVGRNRFGPNTIQQYLREGQIDELHVAITPGVLGSGERLFEGLDLRALAYESVQVVRAG